jgi:Flp pilus assembly protein TadG
MLALQDRQKLKMSTSQTTEPSRSSIVRLIRGCFRRFAGDREASTAIEFTLLAIPFSMLVFAILESCISFAAQEVLATATEDVARQLRTGQLRAADVTQTSLKKTICDQLEVIVTKGCPDLIIDLREFPTFAAAAAVKIKLTSDKDIDTTGFDVKPGKAMSKNMLRVFYKWPVITDFMRKAMSNLKDNKTLHFASVTWQNEPFDD